MRIKFNDVSFRYTKNKKVLKNINLEFNKSEIVFIMGHTGSGKSTLLNIIGGLDSFDRGEIYLYGKKFSKFKKFEYDFYRNTFTGFVFQEYNLINELTIEENVTLALDLQSIKDKDKIDKIFDDLEISELKNRKRLFHLQECNARGKVRRPECATDSVSAPIRDGHRF